MKRQPTFESMAWEIRATCEAIDARHCKLSKPQLRLLQILDGRCRDKFWCWVSNTELANSYGCRPRNLQILLAGLESARSVVRVIPDHGRLRRTGIILLTRIAAGLPVADTPERMDLALSDLKNRDASKHTRAQKIAPTRAQKIAPGIITKEEENEGKKVRSSHPTQIPIAEPSNHPLADGPGPDHFPPKGGPVGEANPDRVRRAIQLNLLLKTETGYVLVPDGGEIRPRYLNPPATEESRAEIKARFTEFWSEKSREFEDLKPELLRLLTGSEDPTAGEAMPKAQRPRRGAPDDAAMPFRRLVGLVREGAAPEAIAQAMAVRYRDAGPITLKTWTAAASRMTSDRLIGFLVEGDGKDDPAVWLSKILGEAMRKDRARDGCRLASAPAPRPGGPEPPKGVVGASKPYHEQQSISRDAV